MEKYLYDYMHRITPLYRGIDRETAHEIASAVLSFKFVLYTNTMTSAEKMEVARTLARLGVDVIEAGFPAASPDDLEAGTAVSDQDGSNALALSGMMVVRNLVGGLLLPAVPASLRRRPEPRE